MATSLRPQALAGRTVLLAGQPAPGLVAALHRTGAVVREVTADRAPAAGPGAVDLLLVGVAVDAATTLAGPVSEVFGLVRDLHPVLARRPAGVLCYLPFGDAAGPTREAVAASVLSLARTLAQEWAADGIRVNCAVAREPLADDQLADLVALLAGPAGAMLTGQLLALQAPGPASTDETANAEQEA